MRWKPWDDVPKDIGDRLRLPIAAPPCPACAHWRPVALLNEQGEPNGVRMCHAAEQEADFSCYRERATADQGMGQDLSDSKRQGHAGAGSD